MSDGNTIIHNLNTGDWRSFTSRLIPKSDNPSIQTIGYSLSLLPTSYIDAIAVRHAMGFLLHDDQGKTGDEGKILLYPPNPPPKKKQPVARTRLK